MPATEDKSITVRVLESLPEDYGKCIARITYRSMQALGAKEGDILEIKKAGGKKWIPARCKEFWFDPNNKALVEYRSPPIRVDEFLRSSIDVYIGDEIKVRKIRKPVQAASEITVTPFQPIPIIESRDLSKAWHDLPVVKGEIMRMNYFGRELTFSVDSIGVLGKAPKTIPKNGRYCIPIIPTTEPVIIKAPNTAIGLVGGTRGIIATGSGGFVFEDEGTEEDTRIPRTIGCPIFSLTIDLKYEGIREIVEYWKPTTKVKDRSSITRSIHETVVEPYFDEFGKEVDRANQKLKDERIVGANLSDKEKVAILNVLRDRVVARWEETWNKIERG